MVGLRDVGGRFAVVPSPVLLAVDEDEKSLRDVERELRDRYERSYRVLCLGSAPEAEAELSRMADAGEEVALVLAGDSLGAPGSELLGGVRKLHPQAQRGLLTSSASRGPGGRTSCARSSAGAPFPTPSASPTRPKGACWSPRRRPESAAARGLPQRRGSRRSEQRRT